MILEAGNFFPCKRGKENLNLFLESNIINSKSYFAYILETIWLIKVYFYVSARICSFMKFVIKSMILLYNKLSRILETTIKFSLLYTLQPDIQFHYVQNLTGIFIGSSFTRLTSQYFHLYFVKLNKRTLSLRNSMFLLYNQTIVRKHVIS